MLFSFVVLLFGINLRLLSFLMLLIGANILLQNKIDVTVGRNLVEDNVLRTFCAGQEGPFSQDLVGGTLGQEVDQGSCLRDEHREVRGRYFEAEGEDGPANFRSSVAGCSQNLL